MQSTNKWWCHCRLRYKLYWSRSDDVYFWIFYFPFNFYYFNADTYLYFYWSKDSKTWPLLVTRYFCMVVLLLLLKATLCRIWYFARSSFIFSSLICFIQLKATLFRNWQLALFGSLQSFWAKHDCHKYRSQVCNNLSLQETESWKLFWSRYFKVKKVTYCFFLKSCCNTAFLRRCAYLITVGFDKYTKTKL